MITIKSKDGHIFEAYHCPGEDNSSNGLIILHDIFGMTPFIKKICLQWTGSGFHVIAPALYDRYEKNVSIPYDEEGYEKALDYKQRVLDWVKQLLDIAAAKDFLRKNGIVKVGVLGLSWGGTLSWLSACRIKGIDCVASYYGTHIFQFREETPKCPCLLHFAEQDDLVPPDHVSVISQLHSEQLIYNYSATHGFRCDDWRGGHGQEYNEKASILADQRTAEFLRQHLRAKTDASTVKIQVSTNFRPRLF